MSVDKTINFTERSAQADTPATGDWRLYFKSGGLYTLDDAGTETLVGSGSGANAALSNLAAVAINTSLISDTDSTDDLGSTSVYWRNAYLDTAYFTEQAAPSTPAAGKVVIYPKSDGLMYSKDDAGTETLMSGGAGGGGMTDFTLAGDSGTPETVADGNTLTIAGGDGITTTVSATDTVTAAVDNTVIRTTGTQSIANGLTITTPTIASFANATHNHSDAAGGGTIDASVITYTPAVNTDWDGDAAPGDVDNALDQLAERVDDLEGAGGGTSPQTILQGFKLRWVANDKIAVAGGSVAHGATLLNKATGTVLTMGTNGDWIDGATGEAASSWAHVYINSSGTLKLHDTMPNNSSPTAATYVATMRVNQSGWNGTAASGLDATSVVYDTDTGEGSITAGMLLGVYSDSAYTLGRGKGSAATATLQNMSFALITAVNTGTNTLTLEAGHQIAINDNDYLIVIENAPVVYRDESGTVWRWLGAMFNNASSNLDTNRLHNAASYESNEGANYTTASTSFVPIDSTNWSHDLILTETRDVQVHLTASTLASGGAHLLKHNIRVDGTNIAADDGIVSHNNVTTNNTLTGYTRQIRNLLPGTHQITAMYAVTAATSIIHAGAGTTSVDTHPQFAARIMH